MFLLMVVVVAVGGIAKGQQPKKMAWIGYLSWLSGTSSTSLAFKQGLRELGWVGGKQIEIEYRNAGDNLDKLSEFATELVRLKVDVIVAAGSNMSTIAAKRATTTIPIVMVGVVDPVTNGLVASLARPGQMLPASPSKLHGSRPGKTSSFLRKLCLRFRAWRSLEVLAF